MSNDGKILEGLVEQIEKLLLPEGISPVVNRRVFDENGVQIAELDIEIRGKLGTADIAWLIECRDRPSAGAAPASWIEQLVGRRDRFQFNKVTAVSTTGFAPGAAAYARSKGIELRTVSEIAHEDVSEWLAMQYIDQQMNLRHIDHVILYMDPATSPESKMAFESEVAGKPAEERLIEVLETGQKISAADIFRLAIESKDLFTGVVANGPEKHIQITTHFPNQRLTVATSKGQVRIQCISFRGRLSVKGSKVPISHISEYAKLDSGETISQSAFFPIAGGPIEGALEFHKVAETGETHVLFRFKKD